jgi:hypothetical protein
MRQRRAGRQCQRLIAHDMQAVGLIVGQYAVVRREIIPFFQEKRAEWFWHVNCVVVLEPSRFASKSHIAWIRKSPG